ncbi:MAG TPA: Crp/Fnr family transcriptional regulator [Taishania sp.]|nr:Crp/Fnr family transcriptional regulator [Taishania sp.]
MTTIRIEDYFGNYFQQDVAPLFHDLFQNTSLIKRAKVEKGTFLMRQGDICQQTIFVEKGLLRYYSIDAKGKEHILHFAPEGWLINDKDSAYFQLPTNYFIEVLEDSEIVFLQLDFFNALVDKLPTIKNMNERLLHNHVRQLQKRITLLLSATAEERYVDFIEIYPNILARVPQWMVASYLGITPESLSRVRKELAEKWKNTN